MSESVEPPRRLQKVRVRAVAELLFAGEEFQPWDAEEEKEELEGLEMGPPLVGERR